MTDAKRGGPRGFDVVRAARTLVDAHEIGDEAAAKIAGVTERSIRNWREALATNGALRAEYDRLRMKREDAWTEERITALRVVLKRACDLAKDEKDLDKLTRFIDKVGGVDVAGKVLSAVGARSDRQGPPPPGGEDGAGEAGGDEAVVN